MLMVALEKDGEGRTVVTREDTGEELARFAAGLGREALDWSLKWMAGQDEGGE